MASSQPHPVTTRVPTRTIRPKPKHPRSACPLTVLVVDRPHRLLHMVVMTIQDDDARPIGRLERTCPVRTAIGVISGKWKPTILRAIAEGGSRYAEIRQAVPGINDQALTRQLRQLCADGVIERLVDRGYQLTPLGERLAGIMAGLEDWGTAYLEQRMKRTDGHDEAA